MSMEGAKLDARHANKVDDYTPICESRGGMS